MFPFICQGQHVLVIWGATVNEDKLKDAVEHLQELTGSSGKVSLENADRLSMASYPASSFDVVLSGVLFPQSIVHSLQHLGEIVKLVKPQGTVIIQEAVVPEANGNVLKTVEKLSSSLKLAGFTGVAESKSVPLTEDEMKTLKTLLNTNQSIQVVEVHCKKPNFEVGSSSKLSFAKVALPPKPSEDVAAVWKLDSVDDDIETIDSNSLLDEVDLKKPDPSSLKVCGTTGKRKACKNCSCGLAEELAAGSQDSTKAPPVKTSACGNCYLGDAFRCASCPYLGMPAFKPGEKIVLSENQLKSDL